MNPVKDFRVSNMAKFISYGVNRGVQNVLQPSSSASPTSTANSVPTLYLDESIQVLWTDSSNSIYYINTTVDDSLTNYTQTFPLLLDTGSGISWIVNENCTSSTCSNGPKFTSTVSTLSAFTLSYSGSSVTGSLTNGKENSVTWSFPRGLSVSNYTFGLTDSVPSFFSDYNISGIIGITSSYSSSPTTNLIYQLYEEGAIGALKFGLILGEGSNTNTSFGGLLLLGALAIDQLSVLGTSGLQYCDVVENSQLYWMVNITSVEVHDTAGDLQEFESNFTRKAIIDTGTTGIALPLQDADVLHAALFGTNYVTDSAGNYAFWCNATGEVILTVGGHNLTMAVDYIRASAYTSTTLSGYCASKIQGTGTDSNWILGASFLEAFYTVFDLEKSQIGFAPRVDQYAVSVDQHAVSVGASSTRTSTWSNSTSNLASSLSANGGMSLGTGFGGSLVALCMLFLN